MMKRHARSRSMWTLAAALPALHACYEYVPVVADAPPVGQIVALQVTDRGRVELGDRFGPGVREIDARLISQQGNDLVLSVNRVTNIAGEHSPWSGDTTRLNRE